MRRQTAAVAVVAAAVPNESMEVEAVASSDPLAAAMPDDERSVSILSAASSQMKSPVGEGESGDGCREKSAGTPGPLSVRRKREIRDQRDKRQLRSGRNTSRAGCREARYLVPAPPSLFSFSFSSIFGGPFE